MKALAKTLLGLAMIFALVLMVQAEEKKGTGGKERTLKGTITCAKCDLKETDKCMTVIKVSKGGKDRVYYFDPASHKKLHGKICTSPKEGEVTGTVSKKGDKMMVKVKDVKFND